MWILMLIIIAWCIVDTKGSHSDLTDDYAQIPFEMKAVAACFGKKVLREVDKEKFMRRIPEVQRACGDGCCRALPFKVKMNVPGQRRRLWRAENLRNFCGLWRNPGIPPANFCKMFIAGESAGAGNIRRIGCQQEYTRLSRCLPCPWRRLCRDDSGICSE